MAHQFDAVWSWFQTVTRTYQDFNGSSPPKYPTVFVSGGPMLAGHVKGKKRSLSSMFEAVGSYAAGLMTEEDVKSLRIRSARPVVPAPVCTQQTA